MKVLIDIENCQECPYSWSHANQSERKTWVCDKLQDNIGGGDVIQENCPLKGKENG